MKKFTLTALLALSSCINPQETANKAKVVQSMAKAISLENPKAPQLSIEDFQKEYAKDSNTVLVDVRTEEEQKISRLPGAITRQEFEANQQAYKDKTIVSYCTIGARSSKYTLSLLKKGYKAFNLKESILGWANRKLPLVTPEGKETKKVHVYGEAWNLLPSDYQGIWKD
jgi:rhodanese-related sulfurtransferase